MTRMQSTPLSDVDEGFIITPEDVAVRPGETVDIDIRLENRSNRTFIASIIYIAVNLIFNLCFIQILHLEEFGIALASSLGWPPVPALASAVSGAGVASPKRPELPGRRWRQGGSRHGRGCANSPRSWFDDAPPPRLRGPHLPPSVG